MWLRGWDGGGTRDRLPVICMVPLVCPVVMSGGRPIGRGVKKGMRQKEDDEKLIFRRARGFFSF